jgi:GxxExxY protein
MGPGLLESVYETALCIELRRAGVEVKRQVGIPLYYKDELISEHRPDVIVGGRIVAEIKCVEHFDPIHTAIMLTYLRVTGLRLGLLLNFKTAYMTHGNQTRNVVRLRASVSPWFVSKPRSAKHGTARIA